MIGELFIIAGVVVAVVALHVDVIRDHLRCKGSVLEPVFPVAMLIVLDLFLIGIVLLAGHAP